MIPIAEYTFEARDQFYKLLETYPDAVPALRQRIIEGKISGDAYFTKPDCGCIIGTLSLLTGIEFDDILFYEDCELSAIEKFVINVQLGDTPDTNPVLARLLYWINSARPGLAREGEQHG